MPGVFFESSFITLSMINSESRAKKKLLETHFYQFFRDHLRKVRDTIGLVRDCFVLNGENRRLE